MMFCTHYDIYALNSDKKSQRDPTKSSPKCIFSQVMTQTTRTQLYKNSLSIILPKKGSLYTLS